jgi:hypothetical protein
VKYLPQLSEDDIRYICSIITYEHTIAYFTKNPKEFAKIRPGFRAKAISKTEMSNLLLKYHNRRFISNFIEKHISDWLSQIQEHINKCMKDGDSKDIALIHTLPFSLFANNVGLYLKLSNEEFLEEYIVLLSAVVKSIKEEANKKEELNEGIKTIESECEKLIAELESKDAELDRSKDRLSSRLFEIDDLKSKISTLEILQANTLKDKEEIESLKKEKAGLLDKIDILSSELAESKNNGLLLEKKIRAEVEKQQKYLNDKQISKAKPLCPSDLDEFKEYLGYNLANIGMANNSENFLFLIAYLSKILFQGVPIVVNHVIGLNLIRCVANTLMGKSTVKMLTYSQDVTDEKIRQFLLSADRIVCLDNFIGNYNETELVTLLEKHRDKIIILTVTYDRTLYYLSIEFQRYCQYLNASRIGALSVSAELTEDPSTIAEHSYEPQSAQGENRFKNILREILRELGYPQSLIEHKCANTSTEIDLCLVLAFDILPYCSDVLQIKPYNTSERLLKYAGKDGRCPQKNLLMRWFAQ